MSKEAMKLALEALCDIIPANANNEEIRLIQQKAIDALREALANGALDKMAENARQVGLDYEPAQQEPVAWMYPDDRERMLTNETFCTVYSVEVGSATRGESTVPLYTSPPAQRKPLTDEEIDAVMPQPAEFGIVQPPWNGLDITILRAMARATEAAHNIKE